MSAVLWFLIGSMVGGAVGIMVMCLVQVNRLHDDDYNGKEEDE